MSKHLRPVFTLDLGYKIQPGLVTVGKFDGIHPCLTLATTNDKVIIHAPHHRHSLNGKGKLILSESNREISTLNINAPITALLATPFDESDVKDILFVGTANNLLAYHVHDNRDIFYRECEDGLKSLVVGGISGQTLIFVGGNSSIKGFDYSGEEKFWISTGDTVCSMLLMDFVGDGAENELLVSSEDFTIKIFKGEGSLIQTLQETEAVSLLYGLQNQKFAYAVANGTIGVYQQNQRVWRVKSKNFAISMIGFDLLGLNSLQLITGWSNGKIDCRSLESGDVLFKDTLSSGIAGLVVGDYRNQGKNDLICVSSEGEVKGYTTTLVAASGNGNIEQEAIKDLFTQKQTLLMELKHYENNTKFNDNVLKETESFEAIGAIPSNTRVQIGVSTKKPNLELNISTNNSTIIKAVILFAEGIFQDESFVVHPEFGKLSSSINVKLNLTRTCPIDIHVKVFVGYSNSVQYHIFEVTKQLPSFSMFYLLQNSTEKLIMPKSWVEFRVIERIQRIIMWINANFLLDNDLDIELNKKNGKFEIFLEDMRDSQVLILSFQENKKCTISTANMFLASDLVQSLAGYLGLEGLESQSSFPHIENELKSLMLKLNDIQEARLKLDTDVAEQLGQIRNLVVKAEDCRINDLPSMLMHYNDLDKLNKNLINGYNVKAQNYNEGIETMKRINMIIQKASRLRVGQNSTILINHCRNAIKNNNVEGLIRIIRTGEI